MVQNQSKRQPDRQSRHFNQQHSHRTSSQHNRKHSKQHHTQDSSPISQQFGTPTRRPVQPQQPEQSPQPTASKATIPQPRDLPTTQDYWIREGHMWKRVLAEQRTKLYLPEPRFHQLHNIQNNICETNSWTRGYRIDDDWTKTTAELTTP